MSRGKSHMGSVYRRSGSGRLYLRIPPKVAQRCGLSGHIATGLTDTPENRHQAEEMLLELTRQYLNMRGLPAVTTAPPISVSAAFALFMRRHAVNRSAQSARCYELAYAAVMRHGDDQMPLAHLVQSGTHRRMLLEDTLERFVRSGCGISRRVSPQTTENYLRTFMIFVSWCRSEGMLSEIPQVKRLRRMMPARTGKPVRIYSEYEVIAMLQNGRESQRMAMRRMADLIDILWRTPLRLHEALEATREDIDVGAGHLVVASKDGQRLEYVPLRRVDMELLSAVAARWAPDGGAILGYHRSSDSRLRRTLYELMALSGVERHHRSFHEFKKSYITRLVRRVGKDLSLLEVSRLSRCGLDVLQRHYLQMTTDDVREVLVRIYGD